MPTFFWRNLLKCLPTTPLSPSSPFPHEADDNDNNIIRSRTATSPPSTKNLTSSTSPDSSSLFSPTSVSSSFSSSVSDPECPVDFAAISASHRLFFSSPGRSKSITESSSESTFSKSPLTGGVAVKKYSPDPYEDFKLSMQEMVEAKGGRGVVDWAYLHELLSCYLTLNPKNAHKFIISAFADITVTLLASSPPESEDGRPELLRRLHCEALSCLSTSWNQGSSRLQPSSSYIN